MKLPRVDEFEVSVICQIMFWHSYPKQHYNSRSVIKLTHDRYYVELQEEHSDLFV